MKLLSYILLILVLSTSCGLTKKSVKAKALITFSLDPEDLQDTLTEVTDSSSGGELNPIRTVYLTSGNPISDVRDFSHSPKSSHKPIKEVIITDNTSVNKKDSEGIISYSIPNEMKVNNSYIIKLRITKDNTENGKTVLIIGDRNIPIFDETVDSKVSIENIIVSDDMSAEILCDTNYFKLTQLNTKTQKIDSIGYTEWSWQVTPQKSGKGYLKLIIKIKSIEKDIVVFDKSIEVKSNYTYSTQNFISSYWQWIMTTIIIPLIIFFYKKRKKKKVKKSL